MLYYFGSNHRNGLFHFECSLNVIVLFFSHPYSWGYWQPNDCFNCFAQLQTFKDVNLFFCCFLPRQYTYQMNLSSGIFGFVRLFIKNSNTFECNKDCSSFRCLKLNLNFKSVILTCYIQTVWFTYIIGYIRVSGNQPAVKSDKFKIILWLHHMVWLR